MAARAVPPQRLRRGARFCTLSRRGPRPHGLDISEDDRRKIHYRNALRLMRMHGHEH